jgi:D-glycero-alpha-D-manno-heptose-7-phosphate kinase
LELVDSIEEIQHPVVRAVLKEYNVRECVDISVMSDLPASGGGLGSSSAFTVGFVYLIRAMAGIDMTKLDVANEAIRFERVILQENVGVQDQLHAAFGGLNRFDFEGGRIRITPVQVKAETISRLNEAMVLIYTGISRRATHIVEEQTLATKSRVLDNDLSHLYAMVGECQDLLENSGRNMIPELGRMLRESWLVKRQLTSKISNGLIDALYDRAHQAGAYGGKLCGAGGGGFILMLCPPDRIPAIRAAVSPHTVLPIRMDTQGVSLLFANSGSPGRNELMIEEHWPPQIAIG